MSEVPVQLIVAAFQDDKSANEALKELKHAQKEKVIKIEDAAVLRKDDKGKLHIKETGDWSGGQGAAAGAVIGGAIGLILGPGALLTGAAGALIGGLAAKFRDSGFNDERLKKLGEGLQPGTSAIVAIVEHKWVEQVEQELAEQATDGVTEAISADIAEQLAAGNEVAISAIADESSASISRVAGNEDEVSASRIMADDESVVAQELYADQEGVAAHQVTITDDGVSEIVGVSTDEGTIIAGEATDDQGNAVAGVIGITPEEETDATDEGKSEA